MKHTIEINDKTKQGKALLEIIRSMPVNAVSIIEEDTISAEHFFSELRKEVKKQFSQKNKTK